MKTGKLLTGLMVAGLASASHAGTINQALLSLANATGNINQLGSYTFNDLSVADFGDVDESETISVGDQVFGAFGIDSILSGPFAEIVDDVSGIYAFEVIDIVGTDVFFGAISGALAGDAAVAIYQGGAPTNAFVNPAAGSFFDPAFSDGDLYGTFDLAPGYSIDFASLDLTTISSLPVAGNIGAINGGLIVNDDGTSDGGEGIGDFTLVPFFGEDVTAGGSIINVPGTAATFNDTADFTTNLIVTPAPAAAGAGLIGLVGLVGRRRRQA